MHHDRVTICEPIEKRTIERLNKKKKKKENPPNVHRRPISFLRGFKSSGEKKKKKRDVKNLNTVLEPLLVINLATIGS